MTAAVGPGLADALRRLAGVPRLLVASDYDGVLAPIVNDPAQAAPLPEAVAVLRGLAALPGTTVAAVSGRARADLAAVSGLPAGEVLLVGSHGAELDDGGPPLDEQQRSRHEQLVTALRQVADRLPGIRLEVKPASVVLHTRTAPRDAAAQATAEVQRGPATWPGVRVTPGKEVVELAVVTVDKGGAVTALRGRSGAGAVLYLGDDVTDEDAFAVLAGDDVGVKVGPGATGAAFRVADPGAAVAVLELLRAHRSPMIAPI